MLSIIASGAIGASIGVIGTYVIGKKLFSTDRILSIIDEIKDDMLTNVDSQKELYSIGVLLGNGIKTGIGLNPRGGKMKFEDLLIMGASHFLQKYLGGPPQQGQEQPQIEGIPKGF